MQKALEWGRGLSNTVMKLDPEKEGHELTLPKRCTRKFSQVQVSTSLQGDGDDFHDKPSPAVAPTCWITRSNKL